MRWPDITRMDPNELRAYASRMEWERRREAGLLTPEELHREKLNHQYMTARNQIIHENLERSRNRSRFD